MNKFSNSEVARLFRQVAATYTVKGYNRFRIIAYEKAADTIEKSNLEARNLWQEDRLADLPGIGRTIAGNLDELFTKGKVRHFDKEFKSLPAGMFPLLEIPGFGPKKAYRLSKEFKLNKAENAPEMLLKLARQNKIAPLEGFGEKSQADIIEALERAKKGRTKQIRMPLPYAHQTALNVLEYLKKSPQVIEAVPLGSLRRMVSTIGDVDIAAATKKPAEVLKWFLNYPKKAKIIETGPAGASILLETGQQIDLRVQKPQSFGAMLQYFTGSKEHNINLRELALKKGLSLSEYGIKEVKSGKLREYDSEEKFYRVLGLPWIPPELREGQGEIETGLKSNLPLLVERKDIKGEVHVHSSYDLKPSHDLGQSSVEEIVYQAKEMGYEYIGISDHNPRQANLTESQIISIMKRRKEHIEQIKLKTKNTRVNIFIMMEVDILPDGKIALPDKAQDFLDAFIVSIHSVFNMDKEKMTKRIISGLSHKKAKIFAHPTGRLIGKRESYEVDWPTIMNFCKHNNKALEINSYPERLDLPDVMVKRAVENGNKLVIDTDAHEKTQMSLIDYGISVARRGWADKSVIINTLPYEKFKSWLFN